MKLLTTRFNSQQKERQVFQQMETKIYDDKFNPADYDENMVAATLDEVGAPADTPAPAKPKRQIRENGKAKTKAETPATAGEDVFFLILPSGDVARESSGEKAAAMIFSGDALELFRGAKITPKVSFE